MAMKLEFWVADGPNGEALDHEVRLRGAWEILSVVEGTRKPQHVAITLTHTSRQRGEWCIWVRPGRRTGTFCGVGPIETLHAKGE